MGGGKEEGVRVKNLLFGKEKKKEKKQGSTTCLALGWVGRGPRRKREKRGEAPIYLSLEGGKGIRF